MRNLLLTLFLVTGALAAQTATLILTGPATAAPGSSVTVSLGLAGSSGQNLAALQWTAIPPAGVTISSVASGAASTAATKTPYCNTGNTLCILVGLSTATPPVITNAVYADGVVATLQVAIPATAAPGPMTIPLTGLLGASTAASGVTITSGTAYSLTVLNKCDVNKDGSVTYLDVQAVLNPALGNGVCPISQGCTPLTVIAVLVAALGSACLLQ